MYIYIGIGLVLVTMFFFRKLDTKRVAVVVLGDIGRSPRMQYHSLSLAEHGYTVDLIGYGGSLPHGDVMSHPRINITEMLAVPGFINNLPRLVVYALKLTLQALVLLITMLTKPGAGHILLQNPPALPTLLVCKLVSCIRGSHFIIDWHNYGYTILGLSLGPQHRIVRIAHSLERWFGGMSHDNICVTKAMKEDLAKNWNIRAYTMYDRPPAIFQTTTLVDRHDLFTRVANEYEVFQPRSAAVDHTSFTKKEGSRVTLLADRPAILVSSTSWTEDEDFSILLQALEEYETSVSSGSPLPSLVCIITGKGPQKAHYQALLAEKSWNHVKVCTPWLEAEDYPKLLGSADLGVCLHKSSSDLDLPMKVVDMFGCGLPVCAVHFKCLHELVHHEENGMVFKDYKELAQQIQLLLTGFPNDCKRLQKFRENLIDFQRVRWADEWERIVKPIFDNDPHHR